MKAIVRLIPVTSIILISGVVSLSGCKLKRELSVSLAETTVKETEASDTQTNETQTNEMQTNEMQTGENTVKESEMDETKIPETEKNTLTGEILYLKTQVADAFDLNKITNCFLGCDETAAQDYLVKPYYDYWEQQGYSSSGQYLYENEFEIVNVSQNGQSKSSYITYTDNKNAAGICYDIYDISGFLYNGIGSSMEKQFPKEDLKSCTRDEAMKQCEKYAVACGYEDADVQVYAMTKEALNRVCNINKTTTAAPDPNFYHPFSETEKWRLNQERQEALEKEDTDLVSSIEQKMAALNEVSYIPWEKKDEAYLLIYRPYINGLLVDGWGQTLVIVYVPQLEKAVLIKGYSPVQVSKKQEKKLISKETAISTAMLEKGIEDVSKFGIKSIELVYSTRAVQFEVDEPSMNPCWKIDYSYPEMAEDDEGSIWIDAVTGFVSKYIENL